MEFSLQAVNALKDMLITKEEGVDSDSDIDDTPASSVSKLGPGNIGPAKRKQDEKSTKDKEKNTKDIWDQEEIPEGSEYDNTHDPRPQPEYDIVFKQAVTSEDMFLQMGNKNPATSSCEDMVVKIKLPGTKAADLTLDVKSKFLDLRTPKYKLGLHLPQPVDHKTGKAQWDASKEMLNVTLRMSRDYDFMNF